MIPIRDSIPRMNLPLAVWTIILANVLVYLHQLGLTRPEEFQFIHLWGMTPARYTAPDWALRMGYPPAGMLPFLTYMFLHGGFFHILLNMWVLWVFADNIEDVMGPVPFLVFYLLCGLCAAGVHLAFNAASPVPMVGASGAIAGVMGAYFLLYPHSRVTTLIPIIIIPWFIDLPATIFLGVWFLSQVFYGVLAGSDQGVAWWAHIGGFVAGILLVPMFRRKDRCHYCYGPHRRHEV